ncbi:MAG: hypothetical protein IJ243_06770 [Prevotella sp.]|nr:hypothetical protein [Prevotella sp.]
MTLHIFNPEHDIALASGLTNFTAPHAGRQLRHDLGWLPALGAPDSLILVDDVAKARRAISRRKVHPCQFVTKQQLGLLPITEIDAWGWNAALRGQLIRAGISSYILPSVVTIETIRQLSHRRTAAKLLKHLRLEGTVGEAFECNTAKEVELLLQHYGSVVIKAPWSSSGRGLHFLSLDRTPLSVHEGWLNNTFIRQGSVMVEPFYHKVKDFGMEFDSDGKGKVDYLGLSLFHTQNGAYTGNILATEAYKMKQITHYIPEKLLNSIKEIICTRLGAFFRGKYQGRFGIDMMLVSPLPTPHSTKVTQLSTLNSQQSTLLHPCVEINLRRTMGHVALCAARLYNPTEDDDIRHVMRIVYENNNYKLTIKRI